MSSRSHTHRVLTAPVRKMLIGLFFLLVLSDGASSEENCSYEDVFKHIGLTSNKTLFYMSRPVKYHRNVTQVNLDLLLYAILEMKEKDQLFVPYVWITMWWQNEYIEWNPDDFCGITSVSVPSEIMWQPDITIEEMIERDKAPPSPYITITHRGNIELTNDQVMVSTCRMHVYKFPFDTQSCSLTFKSFIHSDAEILLLQYSDSAEVTEESREVMRTQSEWVFINMTVTNKTVQYYTFNQSMVIYTITMKRRSALYIVNFLLPILFLLCLDLASFMISDRGGEKLSFKVTVLLAVTVMQLILNEILPASSNRIPLIASYCMGVFTLMMISLLETVVVMFLIERDHAPRDEAEDEQRSGEDKQDRSGCEEVFSEEKKLAQSTCGYKDSPEKMPSELTTAKEDDGSELARESRASRKALDEMRELMKTLILVLGKKEEDPPGYWSRAAKKIHRVFFIFYVTATASFMGYMIFHWNQ